MSARRSTRPPMPAAIAFLLGGFVGAFAGHPILWLGAFFALVTLSLIVGAIVTVVLVKHAYDDIQNAGRK